MIRWIVTKVLGFLSGGVLDWVLKHFEIKAESAVERERMAAGIAIERIRAEIEERKASRDIRLATAGLWEMRLLVFLAAALLVLHSGAVGLDTTFGFGWQIAAYPKPFDEWEGAILLSSSASIRSVRGRRPSRVRSFLGAQMRRTADGFGQ